MFQPSSSNLRCALIATLLAGAWALAPRPAAAGPLDLTTRTFKGPGEEFDVGLRVLANGDLLMGALTNPQYPAAGSLFHSTLTRMAPGGQVLWAKSYTSSGTDWMQDVIETAGGNLVVAGSTSTPVGASAGWVFSTDSAGTLLWQKSYKPDGAVGGQFRRVMPAPGGGFYLVGTLYISQQDYFGLIWIVRIDGSGNIAWSRQFGTTPTVESDSAILRSNGDLLVVADDFTQHGALLVDVDSAGNIVWQREIDQRVENEFMLSETQDGGFLVGFEVYTGGVFRDLLIARFDAAGSYLWGREFATPAAEFIGANALSLADGTFLVAATTDSVHDQAGLLLHLSATGEILQQHAHAFATLTALDNLARAADGTIYALYGVLWEGTPGFHVGLATLSATGEIGTACSTTELAVDMQVTQPALVVHDAALVASSRTATVATTTATASAWSWTIASFCSQTVAAAACTPDATTLCLNDRRFKVTATWKAFDGSTGFAHAVTLTGDTGYFWFFGPTNVELILKALDGCGINQAFWVYGGGLTNVRVALNVKDTVTGQVKTYINPQNTAFLPIQDTGTFHTCQTSAERADVDAAWAGDVMSSAAPMLSPEATAADALRWDALPSEAPPTKAGAPCVPSATALCINNNRFKVEVAWLTPGGQTGQGHAVKLTADTGYFWFFQPSNVEEVIKVLDGCGLGGHYWVYGGGLTDVRTRTTVTDTTTGDVKTYINTLGVPFQPLQDVGAFATCP